MLVADAILDRSDRELGLPDPSQNAFSGTQAGTCLNSMTNLVLKSAVFHERSIADPFPPSNGGLHPIHYQMQRTRNGQLSSVR
jgi:hypothetical protein